LADMPMFSTIVLSVFRFVKFTTMWPAPCPISVPSASVVSWIEYKLPLSCS
jgi:hypothetical protein